MFLDFFFESKPCYMKKTHTQKQTNNINTRHASVRAWKILYFCLAAFSPSYEMGLCLLSHIAKYARPQGIGGWRTSFVCVYMLFFVFTF